MAKIRCFIVYLADRHANAIEYSFVVGVSPRDVSTHGAFVPTTIAAISEPPRWVADLKNTLPDSMLGKRRQSAAPATVEPFTFFISAASFHNATSRESGPSIRRCPNWPPVAHLGKNASFDRRGHRGQYLLRRSDARQLWDSLCPMSWQSESNIV